MERWGVKKFNGRVFNLWSSVVVLYFTWVLQKISLCNFIVLGIWINEFSFLGSIGISVLMTGAVLMHIKVQDP